MKNAKGIDLSRLIALILGVVGVATGSQFELSEEQLLALAVAGAGIYQLINRYVLHKETGDLGIPDARGFFSTTTAWASLGNAGIAVLVLTGGLPEVIPLPEWFLAVAQLAAFILGQDRLLVAKRRLSTVPRPKDDSPG